MSEWRAITVGGHLFEVSSCGSVRTPPRTSTHIRGGQSVAMRHRGKTLSPWVAKNGYQTISVLREGKREKFLVHRIVALAFVPGHDLGMTVNHINGVKTDNRAENLEWVTRSKNTELQWRDGLVDLRGDNAPGRKLSSRDVRIIRRLLGLGATANEIATLGGVSPSTIHLIKRGERWASVS